MMSKYRRRKDSEELPSSKIIARLLKIRGRLIRSINDPTGSKF